MIGIDPRLKPSVIIMSSQIVNNAKYDVIKGLLAHELGHLLDDSDSNPVISEYNADYIGSKISSRINMLDALIFLEKNLFKTSYHHYRITNTPEMSLILSHQYMYSHYPTLKPRIEHLAL